MHTRGAVVRQAPGKYEVVDLEVDDPRAGEVQVKMVASGMCHSDDHVATGDIPVGVYPFAGGHEAPASSRRRASTPRGSRRATTSSSRSSRPAATVAGAPRACRTSATSARGLLAGSRWEDPTSYRLTLDGAPRRPDVRHLHVLRDHHRVAGFLREDPPTTSPLDVACLVGCGVGTGWGSAVNSGEVKPGATTIIMASAASASTPCRCRARGASNVIAVDPVAFKREKAQELGATHAVETMEEATELAKQFTNGQAPTRPSSRSE